MTLNLRASWGKNDCKVLVTGSYKKGWVVGLTGCHEDTAIKTIFDNTSYSAAKKQGDCEAALEICKNSLDTAYVARVQLELNYLKSKGYDNPVIVAPTKPTSKNALAKTAGKLLADKLDLDFDDKISETPCPSRREADRRCKFFDRPKFTGEVDKGKVYVLIDDMITTGATLAELRSYIIKNGGHVAFACSLASNDGIDKQLNPTRESLDKVSEVFKSLGKGVNEFLVHNIGMTPNTLTNAEAEYLASGKGRYALQQHIDQLTK